MTRINRTITVIDFGSNSVKFARFAAGATGRLSLRRETRAMIAAGDDVFQTGTISENTATAIDQSLAEFLAMEKLSPGEIIAAAAASAFRAARNGREMAGRFSRVIGAPVEILGGETEARLLGWGVLKSQGWNGKAEAAVIDIGGGSAEVIRARPGADELEVASFELGAIQLRERHAPPPDDQPYSPQSLDVLDAEVAQALAGIQPLPPNSLCYGAGGGFATLGDMLLGEGRSKGETVNRSPIATLAAALRQISPLEAARRHRLPLRRARIMPAGAAVALRAMECLGVAKITISWAGLREGLALRALDILQIR